MNTKLSKVSTIFSPEYSQPLSGCIYMPAPKHAFTKLLVPNNSQTLVLNPSYTNLVYLRSFSCL